MNFARVIMLYIIFMALMLSCTNEIVIKFTGEGVNELVQ